MRDRNFIFACTYWLAAFLVTHLPPPAVPTVPIPQVDKVIHFSLFLGLVWVWSTVVLRRHPLPKSLIILGAGAILYAIFDEATQPFVGRTAEWSDIVADLGGVVTACTLIWRRGILKA